MAVSIRDPLPQDEAAWRRLWQGYLTFYRTELAEEVTADTWRRLFDPASRLAMRVAVSDRDELAGFAIFHHHESTWSLTADCYLEDLFVDQTLRGQGVGHALIEDLLAIGKARGWSRLYWHTETDNVAARRLYDRFKPADSMVRYRLEF